MQGSLGPAGRRPLGRLGIGTLALTPLVHMLAPRHGLGQDDRGLLQRVTHGFPSLLLKLRVLQEAFPDRIQTIQPRSAVCPHLSLRPHTCQHPAPSGHVAYCPCRCSVPLWAATRGSLGHLLRCQPGAFDKTCHTFLLFGAKFNQERIHITMDPKLMITQAAASGMSFCSFFQPTFPGLLL